MDFLNHYLQYTSHTEAIATFHRWSALVGVGSIPGETNMDSIWDRELLS